VVEIVVSKKNRMASDGLIIIWTKQMMPNGAPVSEPQTSQLVGVWTHAAVN
jgi:hypothetical protein